MSDDEDVCVCEQCDDIFLTKSGLAEHIKDKHATSNEDSTQEEKEKEKPA